MILLSIVLIAAGAALCALEDLVAFRSLRIVLNQSLLRASISVVVSALLVGIGILVIAVTILFQDLSPVVITGLAFLAVGLTARALAVRTLDGSDRMLLCVAAAAFSWVTLDAVGSSLAPISRLAILILVGLAYFESGYVKLRMPAWRSGRQLALVMNMKEFGNKRVAGFLLPRPFISAAASWVIISLELVTGPMLFIGGPVAVVAAISAGTMHLSIALLMGLGRFFFPFVGALLLILATQS